MELRLSCTNPSIFDLNVVVMTLKHFLHYWSFVRRIHQSPMDSPLDEFLTQSFSVVELWCVFLLASWRDLRHHDMIWDTMTWFETPWRDLRHHDVIWDTMTAMWHPIINQWQSSLLIYWLSQDDFILWRSTEYLHDQIDQKCSRVFGSNLVFALWNDAGSHWNKFSSLASPEVILKNFL